MLFCFVFDDLAHMVVVFFSNFLMRLVRRSDKFSYESSSDQISITSFWALRLSESFLFPPIGVLCFFVSSSFFSLLKTKLWEHDINFVVIAIFQIRYFVDGFKRDHRFKNDYTKYCLLVSIRSRILPLSITTIR